MLGGRNFKFQRRILDWIWGLKFLFIKFHLYRHFFQIRFALLLTHHLLSMPTSNLSVKTNHSWIPQNCFSVTLQFIQVHLWLLPVCPLQMLCLLPPWSAHCWPSPTSTLESYHQRLYSLSHIHCGSHWSSLANISLQLIHQTHPELLFQCVCQLMIIMVTGVIYLCSWFRLGLTMTRSSPNSMVVSYRGNSLFGRWKLEFLSLTFYF